MVQFWVTGWIIAGILGFGVSWLIRYLADWKDRWI